MRKHRPVFAFVKPTQNFLKNFGATTKKGLTIRFQSFILLNVRREPITPVETNKEARLYSLSRSAHVGKVRFTGHFLAWNFGGAKRCFHTHDGNSALQSRISGNTRMSCVKVPYRRKTRAGGTQRNKKGNRESGVERASVSLVPIKTKPSEAGSF